MGPLNELEAKSKAEMSWSHPQTGAVHDLDPKQTEVETTNPKLTA